MRIYSYSYDWTGWDGIEQSEYTIPNSRIIKSVDLNLLYGGNKLIDGGLSYDYLSYVFEGKSFSVVIDYTRELSYEKRLIGYKLYSETAKMTKSDVFRDYCFPADSVVNFEYSPYPHPSKEGKYQISDKCAVTISSSYSSNVYKSLVDRFDRHKDIIKKMIIDNEWLFDGGFCVSSSYIRIGDEKIEFKSYDMANLPNDSSILIAFVDAVFKQLQLLYPDRYRENYAYNFRLFTSVINRYFSVGVSIDKNPNSPKDISPKLNEW